MTDPAPPAESGPAAASPARSRVAGLLAFAGLVALAVLLSALALVARLELSSPGVSLNPSGEVSPAASGALTVCAFGDSKGRSVVLDHAVDDALARSPAVVVHLGDMVEQRSPFEFRYAAGLAAGVRARGLPFYVVIGNHEGFDRHDQLRPDDYVATFGLPVSWFRARGVLFVAIDTSDEKTFPEAQARAVDSILAAERPRSTRAVILSHVPPLVGAPIKDKRGYVKQLPPEDSARLVALAEKHGVELVLAGHYHGSRIDRQNGVTYVIAGGGGAKLDGPDELTHYVRCTLPDAGPVDVAVVRVDEPLDLETLRYLVLRNRVAVLGWSAGVAVACLALARLLRRGATWGKAP